MPRILPPADATPQQLATISSTLGSLGQSAIAAIQSQPANIQGLETAAEVAGLGGVSLTGPPAFLAFMSDGPLEGPRGGDAVNRFTPVNELNAAIGRDGPGLGTQLAKFPWATITVFAAIAFVLLRVLPKLNWRF